MDRRAATRIDYQPYLTSCLSRHCFGKAVSRSHTLHLYILPNGGIAVQRICCLLKFVAGIEQIDICKGIGYLFRQGSPTSHIGLPDAEV